MPNKPTPKIKPQPFKHKPKHNAPYNTAAWRKIRKCMIRDNPICNECNREAATVCDHITPVRLGGEFWNVRNLQTLCAKCHNIKSAKESKISPKTQHVNK